MNRIQPEISEIENENLLYQKPIDSNYYSTPKSKMELPDEIRAESWMPLLFILVVYIFASIISGESVSKHITSGYSSMYFVFLFVCSYIGIVWWAKIDAAKHEYTLDKLKIYLIVLFGPLGVLVYSFFTRGVFGGVFLCVKMFLYILGVSFLCGLSSLVVEEYIF